MSKMPRGLGTPWSGPGPGSGFHHLVRTLTSFLLTGAIGWLILGNWAINLRLPWPHFLLFAMAQWVGSVPVPQSLLPPYLFFFLKQQRRSWNSGGGRKDNNVPKSPISACPEATCDRVGEQNLANKFKIGKMCKKLSYGQLSKHCTFILTSSVFLVNLPTHIKLNFPQVAFEQNHLCWPYLSFCSSMDSGH